MSSHDDTIRLKHMRDYAREAVALTAGNTVVDLADNRMLDLALVQLATLIGEAASRVSLNTREKYPQILWPQIISMRNRLIHGYDSINYDILWQTVTADLPPLIAQLEAILADDSRP